MLNIYYKWADTVNSEKLMERVIVRQANMWNAHYIYAACVSYGTCAIPIFTKLKQTQQRKTVQKKFYSNLVCIRMHQPAIGCVYVSGWSQHVQQSTWNCAKLKHRTGSESAIKWNYKLSNKS